MTWATDSRWTAIVSQTNDRRSRRGAVWAGGLGLLAALTIGPVLAPAEPAATPAAMGATQPSEAAAKPRPRGYLTVSTAPNAVLILPPPPIAGSPADKEDRRVFDATRALKGSARWTLAARDAVNYLGAYDCALGFPLTSASTPRTWALLQRVGADAGLVTNMAKDHYNRPRPLVGNASPICTEDQRAGLLKSFSYPSGHSTFGWAIGLLLAEAVPERSSDILARARSFGESRAVCGVHFVSDVEAGRTNGALLVAALHSDAAFRADFQAAAEELKAARQAVHTDPDPAECRIESEAEAHTPWINPTAGK